MDRTGGVSFWINVQAVCWHIKYWLKLLVRNPSIISYFKFGIQLCLSMYIGGMPSGKNDLGFRFATIYPRVCLTLCLPSHPGLGRCPVHQPDHRKTWPPRQPDWRPGNEGLVGGAMRSVSGKFCQKWMDSDWDLSSINGSDGKSPDLIRAFLVEPFHTFSGFNRLSDAMLEHLSSTLFWGMEGIIVLWCFTGRSIFVRSSCRLNILFLDVFEKQNPLSYVWGEIW